MHEEPKTIGTLNGPWAVLLKLMLATYVPLVGGGITWATWVTSSVFAMRARLTPDIVSVADMRVMKLEMTAETQALLLAQRSNFENELTAVRKSNLDLQSEVQKITYEHQRMMDKQK